MNALPVFYAVRLPKVATNAKRFQILRAMIAPVPIYVMDMQVFLFSTQFAL